MELDVPICRDIEQFEDFQEGYWVNYVGLINRVNEPFPSFTLYILESIS